MRRFRRWLAHLLMPDDNECRHLWSDWSEPAATRVVDAYGAALETAGVQARRCLHCNMRQDRKLTLVNA
jgi:hypothetical protein